MTLSKFLYKASRTARDVEVITGNHGVERYAKRRARRWWRRKVLGGLNRRTGL